MSDMPATPERSGMSVARYSMFDAPSNAEFIEEDSWMEPCWSIDCSLCASGWLPSEILVKSPYMRTVWVLATAYM